MTGSDIAGAYCRGANLLFPLPHIDHCRSAIAGPEAVAGAASAWLALMLQLAPRTITDGFPAREACRGRTP